MPFALTLRPPILYASWRGFTVADLRDITDRIADMRKTTGHPAVYLSRIPPGHQAFSEDDQKVLLGFLLSILPHCATIHHVIEGDGFVKSARLATVTNMALATPRPRDFYTHATVEDALRSIKQLHGVDLGSAAGPPSEPPPERASGAFREAVRIVEGRRPPPRKE